jgi:hypothetical protein
MHPRSRSLLSCKHVSGRIHALQDRFPSADSRPTYVGASEDHRDRPALLYGDAQREVHRDSVGLLTYRLTSQRDQI